MKAGRARWAFGLSGFGLFQRELERFSERRAEYDEQLRGLEAKLAATESTSEQFEQICLNLQALQATAPIPPKWAFWLR